MSRICLQYPWLDFFVRFLILFILSGLADFYFGMFVCCWSFLGGEEGSWGFVYLVGGFFFWRIL